MARLRNRSRGTLMSDQSPKSSGMPAHPRKYPPRGGADEIEAADPCPGQQTVPPPGVVVEQRIDEGYGIKPDASLHRESVGQRPRATHAAIYGRRQREAGGRREHPDDRK
jgi:hypothetical protein